MSYAFQINHNVLTLTTGSNGTVSLYDKTIPGSNVNYSTNNALVAFASGIRESLYCTLYTWNGALYLIVRDINGTAYANKTISVDIITYKAIGS